MTGPDRPVSVVLSANRAAEEYRALSQWLSGVDFLRDRVRTSYAPTQPGHLGSVIDAIVVAVGPAGAFVGVLATWLRYRGTDVTVRVRRDGGAEIEVTADRLRALDADGLADLATTLAARLDEADDGMADGGD